MSGSLHKGHQFTLKNGQSQNLGTIFQKHASSLADNRVIMGITLEKERF
jgi:hypothetical protein